MLKLKKFLLTYNFYIFLKKSNKFVDKKNLYLNIKQNFML